MRAFLLRCVDLTWTIETHCTHLVLQGGRNRLVISCVELVGYFFAAHLHIFRFAEVHGIWIDDGHASHSAE